MGVKGVMMKKLCANKRRLKLVAFFLVLLIGTGFSTIALTAPGNDDDALPDLETSLSEDLGDGDSSDSPDVTKNTEPSSLDDGKQAKSAGTISLDDEPVDGEMSDEELLSDDSIPTKKSAKKSDESWDGGANSFTNDTASSENLPTRSVAEDVSTPYSVTNLEFKINKERSDIILSSTRKPTFTPSQSTSTNQFVYILDNAETGEKLQRAYDTSEFRSPVAMFTLFQVPGAVPPVSKLIVQMREASKPEIIVSDRGLTLSFPPPSDGSKEVVIGGKKKEILSGQSIYGPNQTFSGELIERLEIKNSDVQDVLRLIARTSGFNIVIGDDVSGNVGTMSLENIPWDQAFTLVLQSKKLGYIREGNVIRVGTTNALKAEKDEAFRIEESSRRVEPLKTLLIPVSYAKASGLAPRANGLLSERGKIETDERTNTIIIKDIETAVNKVQKLISALDTPPPRVQITARIMEVKNGFQRRLGFSGNSFAARLGGISLDQTASLGSNDVSITNVAARNFGDLQLRFTMGELNNEARTLANPSVVVVANQTATVTQKSTIFIPVAAQTALGAVSGGPPALQQVPVTLNLSVTPIVAGDGSIFMTVSVNNDIAATAGGNFAVDNRSINTQVLVENGGTAVIGGVFQNTYSTDRQGIPLLMDIPILGFFFTNRNQTESKNQVLIFLSARILNAEESFKRSL
jgi:type IV pilus assembly protein PilQ